MKAWLCRRYGGPEVLELAELPTPVPGPRDILVRIHATSVSSGDWRIRTLTMPAGMGPVARLALGVRRPRQPILGSEMAGVVEAVGGAVTRFRPGDAVMAFDGFRMGFHAEFRTLLEDGPVAPMPPCLSFEEAASLPFGASTALHFLRKAHAGRGRRVLVVGASGAVGSALVQVARHLGCVVTAATSAANRSLAEALGAERVIDYHRDALFPPGLVYDIVADAVGSTTFAQCRAGLAAEGRYLSIAGGLGEMLAAVVPRRGGQRIIAGPATESPALLREIAALAEAGVLRPVIDRVYGFEALPEAHAYVATRRKRGSVIVRVVEQADAALARPSWLPGLGGQPPATGA